MKKYGYIEQNSNELWKKGQITPYYITRKTKQEIELGILHILYTDNKMAKTKLSFNKIVRQKLKKQNIDKEYDEPKKIRKILIYMILTVQATKAPTPFPDKEYFQYPYTVSVNDIMNGVQGVASFWYLNFKLKRKQVEDTFQILEREKILKKIISPKKRSRFIIADPNIEKFIIDCLMIRDTLIAIRFRFIWRNLRNPSPEEREYFEYYYGKNHTNCTFNEMTNILKQTRNLKRDSPEYVEWKKRIDSIEDLDHNIYDYVNEMKKNHKNLLEFYPILEELFFESIYPPFVKREVEMTNKKQIKSNGKYIKKPHFGTTIITPWGSKQASKPSQS